MPERKLFIWLILTLNISVFIGCVSEVQQSEPIKIELTLIGQPHCKQPEIPGFPANIPANQSCIDYSYDNQTKVMYINHLNAGFNCCPETLSFSVLLRRDTIHIQEIETGGNCKCNCLYDLNFEVTGLKPDKYHINIVEPYLGSQEKLNFEINLTKQTHGKMCVTRNQYPWTE